MKRANIEKGIFWKSFTKYATRYTTIWAFSYPGSVIAPVVAIYDGFSYLRRKRKKSKNFNLDREIDGGISLENKLSEF